MDRSDELRQQIEDLALQVLVAEPGTAAAGDRWEPALQSIRDAATRDQNVPVASIAAELMKSVGADSTTNPDSLQAGIIRLQQALETESNGQAGGTNLAQDPELMADFVLESREHLVSVESQLLNLESDPRNAESLNAVFRGFHTIKG